MMHTHTTHRVMTTPALRGTNVSIATYVEQLSQVFPRTEKVIQLRILLALAALVLKQDKISEDFEPIQTTILQIFGDAQTSGRQEEWVRMIAGMVQDIVFDETVKAEEEDIETDGVESAQKMLQKACNDIIESVQKLEGETENDDHDDDQTPRDHEDEYDAAAWRASRLRTADIDPTMAPFRYSLLKPSILEHTVPTDQSHFVINTAADLLQVDARLEAQKAQEEAEHNISRNKPASAAAKAPAGKKLVATPGPVMPGLSRKSKSPSSSGTTGASKAKVPARQSNMFLNTRKPAAAAARGGLHVRKAGASQRLVGKSRTLTTRPGGATGVAGNATAKKTSLIGGRAKLRDQKASKMKMLDVSEVAGLAKGEVEAKAAGLAPKKGLKRKIMMSSAQARVAKATKTEVPAVENGQATKAEEERTPAPAPAAVAPAPQVATMAAVDALAAAALSNYQKQVAAAPKLAPAPAPPAPAPNQLDWRELLATRSNKLSPVDRQRIAQFFDQKFNPTPEQGDTYRVKLHEERGADPQTGDPIKWTYYLNLNYNDWTSTQSKKRKRYD